VALMLASANRDPAEFPDPNRLDVTRPFAGHVALGLGRNSCVGAMLIRQVTAIATGALVRRFANAQVESAGDWRVGSGFCFPASVYARFRAGGA
jgi:cytochrome P450